MKINFDIHRQPDDSTCGPTCLQAIYRYFGLSFDIRKVIDRVKSLEGGGTLGVFLAIDALEHDFNVAIYNYNLALFDPTWSGLSSTELVSKLRLQQKQKKGKRLQVASDAYCEYLEKGGRLCFDVLTPELLHGLLQDNAPVITGLSCTYLYNTSRERAVSSTMVIPDDTGGYSAGHFIVLVAGNEKEITIADPYHPNPISESGIYSVNSHRVILSIMLGVLTYDANLIVIRPKSKG
jgi:hypothetical protein